MPAPAAAEGFRYSVALRVPCITNHHVALDAVRQASTEENDHSKNVRTSACRCSSLALTHLRAIEARVCSPCTPSPPACALRSLAGSQLAKTA
eukprot:COSAG06_NODE_6059_length_3131_cov_3.507256_1_plen_92_part_10